MDDRANPPREPETDDHFARDVIVATWATHTGRHPPPGDPAATEPAPI